MNSQRRTHSFRLPQTTPRVLNSRSHTQSLHYEQKNELCLSESSWNDASTSPTLIKNRAL